MVVGALFEIGAFVGGVLIGAVIGDALVGATVSGVLIGATVGGALTGAAVRGILSGAGDLVGDFDGFFAGGRVAGGGVTALDFKDSDE